MILFLIVIIIINRVRSNSADHSMASFASPVLGKNATDLVDARLIFLYMELTSYHNGMVELDEEALVAADDVL